MQVFEDLISNSRFKYIFLSYNNEGLMTSKEIKDIMSRFGTYSCFTQEYKKFKASRLQKNETTIEYLHCLVKSNLFELKT